MHIEINNEEFKSKLNTSHWRKKNSHKFESLKAGISAPSYVNQYS